MTETRSRLETGKPGVVHDRSGTLYEALTMSAPLVVSFVSFSLMSTVDMFIMGRVGTPEQGAVGLGGMLCWMFGTLFVGTMTVINTFVAQDVGAGLQDRLRRHVHTGLVFILPFSVAVWAAIPFLDDLIRLFGTSPEVAPFVITYASIRLLEFPFRLTSFALTSFLRGLGNMRTPMYVTVAANVVNAALSVVLVFGYFGFPRLGVAGAAIATVISGAFEALLYVLVYLSRDYHERFKTRHWLWPTPGDYRRFLRVGFPIGLTWLFDMIGWTFFTVYSSTLAPAALAAHMVVFQVMHFSFLPAAAISVVATTLVGQYIGARRVDLAAKAARAGIAVGVGYMTAAGLAMILFRYPLIRLFNPDLAVIAVGVKIIILAAIFQPFDGVNMVVGGSLRGAGDTRFPMLLLLFSGFVIFVPGVLLFGEVLGWGIMGAWAGAVVHVVFVAFLISLRFRRGKWKRMNLTTPAD